MSDHWTDRLSQYLDGELGAAQRAALEAHLDGCDECRGTLAELRRVVARAQALEDTPPARDLWPAIARGIGAPVDDLAARRERRRLAFTLPQLAAAAIALMLVSAGTVWKVLGPGSREITPAPSASDGPVIPVSTGAERLDTAIAELERTLALGRAQLDTSTVRVLEKNLAIIDRAIAEARAALEADPASAYLNYHLARTMRRKLELLRQAGTLVPART